jgi:hypothetical protein
VGSDPFLVKIKTGVLSRQGHLELVQMALITVEGLKGVNHRPDFPDKGQALQEILNPEDKLKGVGVLAERDGTITEHLFPCERQEVEPALAIIQEHSEEANFLLDFLDKELDL